MNLLQNSILPEIYENLPNNIVNDFSVTNLNIRITPSVRNKNKLVFLINGLENPKLILYKGLRYKFNINTLDHNFYLCDEKEQLLFNRPTDFNCFIYKIDKSVPSKFYYKCNCCKGNGGEVIVV